MWVDECGRDEDGNGTGENTTRQYFCRDGVKTELTQQRYVPGKDVRNIRILDAQQGRVLAAYDTKTGTVHDVDKDGTTYTQPMNWDIYGGHSAGRPAGRQYRLYAAGILGLTP